MFYRSLRIKSALQDHIMKAIFYFAKRNEDFKFHCSDDECEGTNTTKAEKHPDKTIIKVMIPPLYRFY